MRSSLSAFGYAVLLIVMVIVLLLVARSWKAVAPTATQISSPTITAPGLSGSGEASSDATQGDGEEGEAPPRLPDLNETRQRAAEHQRQLEEARKKIDE